MKIDLAETAKLLSENDCFLILTHVNPDGDTLGSGCALCKGLQSMGKKAKVICGDNIPKKYSFLSEGLVEQEFEPRYFVAVDVADPKLLGDTFCDIYSDKIDLCIDHHGSNKKYAKNTFLNENDAATAEGIYKILCQLKVKITSEIADCIYTGISTDTGCFRYSNVTAQAHRIAAKMIEAGANCGDINREIFETKSINYIELQRLCIEGMQMYFNNLCAVITLTQDMINKCGCDENDSDGISSLARQIEGVLVGVTIREKKDGTYKISVRTHAPIDASVICANLNGGGHARASGCELAFPLNQVEELILHFVETALKEADFI